MNEKKTDGQWSSVETKLRINYLEMKALLLGLQSLCSDVHDIHICIQSDNTTAVLYINSMGGGGVKSENCDDMAFQIWEWCISKQIWLNAQHIPESQNVQENLRILLSGCYQQKCFSPFLFNGACLILTCLHHDLTIK